MRRLLPLFALFAAAPCVLAQTSTPSYRSDPKFQSAVQDARKLSSQDSPFAADAWKKANKLSGESCQQCLNEAFKSELRLGDSKGALSTAKEMQAEAKTPLEKSLADMEMGTALYRQGGDKPKPTQLEAAHAALTSAIAEYPKNISARYTDGCVLARLGKMDDAKQQFAACAEDTGNNDAMHVRAEHFAENPALSLNRMAPPIVVDAADGSKFNLDNMGGHVVLVDFWATWCGPCNEELPHLQKIVKEFQGQPLTVISVSWDRDEQKWRDFIKAHEMTWVQYRDADHSLTKQFGVPSIPHYFLIDSDGVLYPQMLGADSDVEGKIRKFLARAAKEKAAAPQGTAAGD